MASPFDGIDARIAAAATAAEFDALGDLCERGGGADPALALTHADRLRARAVAVGSPFGEARALRASVAACAYAGRLDEAVARADEARAVAGRAGETIEHARAGVASMHALAKLGRLDEAIARGAAARDALNASGRADLAARAELNLANIHKIRGEHAEALAALERALAGVPASERAARGTIENTLGETLLQLDRLSEARAAFDRAEALLDGLALAQAIVIGNRADLAAREGAFGEALREFDRAAALVRDAAPGHHARLLLEQAEALTVLGGASEAAEILERALLSATSRGLRHEEMRGLLARARARALRGFSADADADARRAEALATEIGDRRSLRLAAGLRSELVLAAGDATLAATLAAQSAAEAGPLDAAVAATRASRAHLALNAPERALSEALAAREAGRGVGVALVEADACVACANAQRALGRLDEAIGSLERAVELSERTRGMLAAERHRLAFGAARLRAYEDLALDLLARGDDASLARAFDVVERARSRALLDAVIGAVDRSAIRADDSRIGSRIASLRARLNALHSTIDRGASGERRMADPARIEALRAIEHELDDLLAQDAVRRGPASLYAAPMPLAAIASRLAEDDLLVSYFEAGEEVLALVVHGGRTRCLRALVARSDLVPIVEKYLFAMREGTRRGPQARGHAARALGRELHRLLVAPVLAATGGGGAVRRLVIVPCGVLHAVPFAALSDGERHLVERHEIATAPSATLAFARRTAPTGNAARRAVVVSVADADAPLIADEARSVAGTLAAHGYETTILEGSDATAPRVRAAVRGAGLVHFACHGRFVPRLPAASGLLLGDGWMPIRDIVELELEGATVVLSGCETGRQAVEAGDELVGIARSLLAAGAGSIVTSLWSVQDAAAAPIAERVVSGLAEGLTPSCALRAAMLASLPNAPHPSWWAPFTSTGAL